MLKRQVVLAATGYFCYICKVILFHKNAGFAMRSSRCFTTKQRAFFQGPDQ